MRGDFALKMIVAHGAGLLVSAITLTLMSSDPEIGEAIMLFVLSAIASLLIFLPVLMVSVVFAPNLIRNRVAFLLLGPVAVTVLVWALYGDDFWMLIACQTGLSSLVLFLLLRGADDPESAVA